VLVVTLQAWGQQRVDALRSAIIFGLEPVFAAVTAWLLLGERMGAVALAGAALVVLALIWSQWQPPRPAP
jgi:drug/metabolite transporter (DMT)-like permease